MFLGIWNPDLIFMVEICRSFPLMLLPLSPMIRYSYSHFLFSSPGQLISSRPGRFLRCLIIWSTNLIKANVHVRRKLAVLATRSGGISLEWPGMDSSPRFSGCHRRVLLFSLRLTDVGYVWIRLTIIWSCEGGILSERPDIDSSPRFSHCHRRVLLFWLRLTCLNHIWIRFTIISTWSRGIF
jgi:hypothetical protein